MRYPIYVMIDIKIQTNKLGMLCDTLSIVVRVQQLTLLVDYKFHKFVSQPFVI